MHMHTVGVIKKLQYTFSIFPFDETGISVPFHLQQYENKNKRRTKMKWNEMNMEVLTNH